MVSLSSSCSLHSNSIGPQGAKALADALKINRTLAFLRYVSLASCFADPRRRPRKPSHQMLAVEGEGTQSGGQEIQVPAQWRPGVVYPKHISKVSSSLCLGLRPAGAGDGEEE